MEVTDRIKKFFGKEKNTKLAVILGAAGMFLILLSSVIPDKERPVNIKEENVPQFSEDYRSDTEKELREFLKQIEGAGDVRVYITVGSSERYVYAAEGKKSRTEERSEEEEKYVIIGGENGKTPVIQRVELPEITGAAVICTGGDIPEVRERIYRTVSAALGLPTGKIYVTKLG